MIHGYAAASDGSLTSIPGSPFPYSVDAIALNGGWLFGAEAGTGSSSGQLINSFSIAKNGALTLKHQTYVKDSGGGVINLFLDHTGSSLYVDYYTTNNDYLSYSIDQANGGLTFLGILHGGPENNSVMRLVGNNQYAYSSNWYHCSPNIFGVRRGRNGDLAWLSVNAPYPTPPPGTAYMPFFAAADPTNHLAIAMAPSSSYCSLSGPYQLATYTVDSAGNLTTTSTYKNMPGVLVGSINYYSMSPSGKFLAVGGSSGLQVFHFNGASPITKYTGLLTNNQVDQMFWDNANHLYAISRAAGKLYVFTVTSNSATQAPGSPHAITSPSSMIVLPKT
ncbi:MAG: hypothetical protein JO159_06995 [Acidobacteria bacterium]|nr:hypothetical protein [Acidobacteriota bacterium]